MFVDIIVFFMSVELVFPILALLPIVLPRIIMESVLALMYIPVYTFREVKNSIAKNIKAQDIKSAQEFIFVSFAAFCILFPIRLVVNTVSQVILTPFIILVMPIVQTIRVRKYKNLALTHKGRQQNPYEVLPRHAFNFADPKEGIVSIRYVCDPSYEISSIS